MSRTSRASRVALPLCLLLLSARTAHAHLELLSPASRYGGDVLKDGPCGRSGGARSDHVTTFHAGETIEVRWNEYVDHPGHFRIAFDADGDDDFEDPRCTSGCTGASPRFAAGAAPVVLADLIPDTSGGEGSATVTLPDVACARCTLQVIQVMYDKPPYTSPGNDIYYQCADVVLVKDATAPATTDEPNTSVGCACVKTRSSSALAAIALALAAALRRARPRSRKPATMNA